MLLLTCSCQTNRISIIEEKINQSQIAAHFVNAPFPEQYTLIQGEKLYIDYHIEKKKLPAKLELFILYKDLTEKSLSYPLKSTTSTIIFKNMDNDFITTGGILAYEVLIISDKNKKPLAQYTHKLWVDLIKPPSPQVTLDADSN